MIVIEPGSVLHSPVANIWSPPDGLALAITDQNRKWWTQQVTDALGAAMAMGAALTAVGAVVAAVVIRGKPKHELSARGGPELPRPVAP
jgi:hypothetical protein